MAYQTNYAKRGPTPQKQAIPGREAEQVPNNEGGFVFALDDWKRLDRFLILGSDAPTYYANAKDLTIENAQCVERCIKADGKRTVDTIVAVSHAGRAPKNDPALFALALCAAAEDVNTRLYALANLRLVARIGTHLFQFAAYVTAQRGWGRALKRAIADGYYALPDVEKVALQAVKYQQRDGWSHRDMLRLTHPDNIVEEPKRAVIRWATHPEEVRDDLMIPITKMSGGHGKGGGKRTIEMSGDHIFHRLPSLIHAYEALKREPTAAHAVQAIREHNLPREAIPTELLNDLGVWEALLEDMPMTAMVRNLGKMSSIGLLKPLSVAAKHVAKRLVDTEILKRARMHPFNLLLALKIYGQGHGEKGSLKWKAVPQLVDALDKAFYLAFDFVEPTGKSYMLGIDVSGSMSSSLMGSPLHVNEGAAALAMTIARTESEYMICAFDDGLRQLPISAGSSLRDVLKHTKDINGGGTDCALPMLAAIDRDLAVDVFVVLTDNETHSGRRGHPVEALQAYRRKTGIPAKLIVCGMTATQFTVADPKDPGMLDVVGFDSAAPTVMAGFAAS